MTTAKKEEKEIISSDGKQGYFIVIEDNEIKRENWVFGYAFEPKHEKLIQHLIQLIGSHTCNGETQFYLRIDHYTADTVQALCSYSLSSNMKTFQFDRQLNDEQYKEIKKMVDCRECWSEGSKTPMMKEWMFGNIRFGCEHIITPLCTKLSISIEDSRPDSDKPQTMKTKNENGIIIIENPRVDNYIISCYHLTIFQDQIVLGSDGGKIFTCNLEDNLMRQIAYIGETSGLATFNDCLIALSANSQIFAWDSDYKLIWTKKIGEDHSGNGLVVWDDKLITACGYTLKIWNEKWQYEHELIGHRDCVGSFVIFKGCLVTGSADETIRFWNKSRTCIRILSACNMVISLSTMGNMVVSTSYNRIEFWNANGELLRFIELETKSNTSWLNASYGCEGRLLVGGDDKMLLAVTVDAKCPFYCKTDTRINAIIPYGDKIVVGCDQTIRIYDQSTILK